MSIKEKLNTILKNKKIALLGLGLENQAILKLSKDLNLKFDFTICDFRNKEKLIPILKNLNLNPNNFSYQLETKFNHSLFNFDILFRSPGWPLTCPGLQEAAKKSIEISSPMNLFFDLCPSQKIIAVTGSKGKGTTATLIFNIIKETKQKVFLGGNIGISPLSFLNKIKKDDYVILELSSFQLEDLKTSPQIAIITNLYKEHLSPADPNNPNYHNSFKKYIEAKANIFIQQDKDGILISKEESHKLLKDYLKDDIAKYKGKIILYKKQIYPTKLKGNYNQENINAAMEVVKILNIDKKLAEKTILNFSNLEHRLEYVAKKNGVKYFNNSFSTTPESTQLDLQSFSENIILIAGGSDKGANFSNLAKSISKKVKHVILFDGEGSHKLKKALEEIDYQAITFPASSMEEAVKIASRQTQVNDLVLLSPACASFGIFKNYKERGNLFKQQVKKL